MLRKLLPILLLALLTLAAAPAFAQGLSLSTRVSHPFLPANSHEDVSATIRVAGGEAFGDDKRAPLNLALVIDRSTSMRGNKIVYAKKASHELIDMLGPTDRLAIVSYGSDVSIESDALMATDANKEILHNAVDGVNLRGGTNLSGGYEKGLGLVKSNLSDETINRVLLLSDGRANEGIVSVPALGHLAQKGRDAGVTLTTLGIGLNFNEVLMTRMAREGAGNYHFVEDERALAKIFMQEWNGLSSAVAKNARVRIELGPGVELKKLHGFSYTEKRNVVTVPLAAFFAHQKKDLLLELAVSTTALGKASVAKVKLTWTDPLDQSRKAKRIALATTVTSDVAKQEKVDKDVLARVEQLRVSETMEKAMTEYEKGNNDKALELLAKRRASMKANQARYDFEADSFDRVGGELKEMEKTVKSKPASSKDGKRLKKRARKRSYDVSQSVDLF